MEREKMTFDVVVVGGGPAGLASAIRLKQLAIEQDADISVCLIEKGAHIGAHSLSGALFDLRALEELFPDWRQRGAPCGLSPEDAEVLLLSARRAFTLPSWLFPRSPGKTGNALISLGDFCQWLAREATALGVELFPGFAGSEVLFNPAGAVLGVATGEMGRQKNGSPGRDFQPGVELHARYTLFAEGCRGHLGKALIRHFGLDRDARPQTYRLGFKELWSVPATVHRPGRVIHAAGWPLAGRAAGGGFVYHLDRQQVAVGLVVGLGYANPYLSPFEEFQRFKTHPAIRRELAGGQRIGYGARTLVDGGISALPRLAFPGGALLGDDAGFLDARSRKGIHTAMKSGMLAAEACFDALQSGRQHDLLEDYALRFRQSWLHDTLQGGWGGLAFRLPRVRAADHLKLKPATECPRIDYPAPDGILTFDRLSSLALSGVRHEENQPCHLRIRDPGRWEALNASRYDLPETRYCPAEVYVRRQDEGEPPSLAIRAANCLHCKACDIKDPGQQIDWFPPQGGDGPNYTGM